MNQKVIEAIKKNEIDLNDIKSWETILETNERELVRTKLPRWPPNDLYILEREDVDGFKEVWSTIPTEMKVKGRKLLQYIQEEEQKKRAQEQNEEIRRLLEIKKLSVEGVEKIQGNSHIQIHNFVGTDSTKRRDKGNILETIRTKLERNKELGIKCEVNYNLLIFDKSIQNSILGSYSPKTLLPLRKDGNTHVIDVPRLVFAVDPDKKHPFIDRWIPKNTPMKIFLASTGYGKTHRIMSYGMNNYLLLLSVSIGSTEKKNIDSSVDSFCEKIKSKLSENVVQNSKMAESLTKVLLVSRLLYFIFQFQHLGGKLTPELFLLSQLNGNTEIARIFFDELKDCPSDDIDSIWDECLTFLKERKVKFSVALDEAHVFELGVYMDNFISATRKNIHGLLSPFKSQVISLIHDLGGCFIVAGTSLSVAYASVLVSGDPNHEIVSDFSMMTYNSVAMSIQKIVNMAGHRTSEIDRTHFPCRKKVVYNILSHLKETEKGFKNDLENSFIASETEIKSHVRAKISTIEKMPEYLPHHELLRKIVGSIAQGNPNISCSGNELMNVDIIDLGLFIMKRDKDTEIWCGKLEEKFIFDLCKATLFKSDFFKKSFGDLYKESANLLYNVLSELGPTSSEKGLAFQKFFLTCLLNGKFQNKKLIELPFIRETLGKEIKLPEWMNAVFKCDSVVTSNSPEEDIKFFNGNPVNNMLIPSNQMHPDGLHNLKYGNGIVVTTLGVKTTYETISGTVAKDNFYSTDLQNIYKENDHISRYVDQKKHVDKWYGEKIIGRIRICIGFPNTSTSFPSTYNPDNDTLFLELNESNIHLLIQNEDTLKIMKGLLYTPFNETEGKQEKRKTHCTICGLSGHYQSTCTSEERNYKKRKIENDEDEMGF
jgi:hypothetical protein